MKRRGRIWARWLVSGPQFKRYTDPNPPAQRQNLRIAVCYLIPLLGDVVMLFPLLDALRREQPEAEIVAFVAGIGKILRMHPAVNVVYERPRPSGRQTLWPLRDIGSLWLWWWRELRHEHFDVIVMPRGGSDPCYSTHLAWLLGGRERVGYSTAVEPEREGLDLEPSPLLTREVTTVTGVHEIERGAEVLRLAGLISGAVETADPSPTLIALSQSRAAQEFLAAYPELSKPYFLLSPGASAPHKEWPEAGYAAVARVIQVHGWLPVVVGGPEVRAMGDRILAELDGPSLNLAGDTDFTQLVAVSAAAQCFIGNDSGTGHVAGAVGTPAVVISSYALSNRAVHQSSPQRTHPFGPWHIVVQPESPLPPCTEECTAGQSHCIQQVTVDQVLSAFAALMERQAAAGLAVSSLPA